MARTQRSGGVHPPRRGILARRDRPRPLERVCRDEREEFIRAFEEVEAAIEHFPGATTVLVRVASVDALRDAYPSYFADTRTFVAELEKAIA